MPEDAPGTEEVTQDAPESGPEDQAPASESTTDSPAVDYEQRYNDLRPQYDRTQNELTQYRSVVEALANPETRAEVLQRFGIELQDDEEPEDVDTDEPITRAEFQAFLAAQQEQESALAAEEQALNTDAQLIASDLEEIQKQYGELSDDDLDILLPVALQNRREDGAPGFKEAFERLNSVAEKRHQAYLESKRAPRVLTGAAGTDKVNLADDDERQRIMADILQAEEAAQG